MENNQSISSCGKAVVLPVLFGFFVMGFVDVVGIATNYVKEDYALSDTLANLIPMMVFLWFAVFSVPTGILMGKCGRRNTVAIALGITAIAMLLPLLHYDFASILVAFALLGIGNTVLQVSLNPMVANVVSADKITSVLTLGQFFKAVSSFLGPIIASAAAAFWGDWKFIFAVYSATTLLSIVWLLLAVCKDKESERAKVTFQTTLSLFKDKYIVGLFLGILFIVGIDVGLNTSIPKLLMEQAGLPLGKAGLGTSLYFASRTIGSFVGAILLAKLPAARFLKISMVLAIVSFVCLLFAGTKEVMFGMIVVVGLACSNVFSILFAFALRHRPDRDNEISALMIMGVSGGALVTPFMGVVADWFGQVAGLSVLLVCMAYIVGIAFRLGRPAENG